MRFLAQTKSGLEGVCALEIREITGVKAETADSVAIFDAEPRQGALFCFYTQSARHVLALLDSFAVPDFEQAVAGIRTVVHRAPLQDWLGSGMTFSVNCVREGGHGFTSQDIAYEAVQMVAKKTGATPNRKLPDVTFLIYIRNSTGYVGIDLAGFDLAKRDFRIFSHSSAVSALICYALVRLSGCPRDGILMDPFAASGTVAIEAALWMEGISPSAHRRDDFSFPSLRPFLGMEPVFDNTLPQEDGRVIATDNALQNLRSAEKNAKIAGVKKRISFSRTPLEYLDIHTEAGSVHAIVTILPSSSKRVPAGVIEKLYAAFMKQAARIISSRGTLAVLTKDATLLKKHARGFTVRSSLELRTGETAYELVVLGKHARN